MTEHEYMGLLEGKTATEKTEWDIWFADVSARFTHSLDGDQKEDGYSLDWLSDMFDAGLTPTNAAVKVRDMIDYVKGV